MNRRTVLGLCGSTLATGLAGCAVGADDGEDGTPSGRGADDGSDGSETETDRSETKPDGTETETDRSGTEPDPPDTGPEVLIVHLENEAGDPVWSGVSVTVELPGSPTMNHNVTAADLAFDGGQFRLQNQDRPGEYRIVVEGGEIDTVEEVVRVPEGSETTVTIVVEGHPGDTPTGGDR